MSNLKVGDEVLIEQAWEDQAGNYHDQVATVSKILEDGRLQFRIGHWKSRKTRDQMIQAWLNKMEWRKEDVTVLEGKRE